MPGPADRDTVVDRDQPDRAAGNDRWSPGGAPPAPGWYEDPWKATSLRRWDGTQWTGETMAKGSTPDAPPAPAPPERGSYDATGYDPRSDEPTGYDDTGYPSSAGPAGYDERHSGAARPAPVAPGPRPRRALPNPFLVGGIAVAMIVVIAAVVMSGHSGSTASSTTLPPAPSPTVAKPIGLTGSVLTAADLGKGWTAAPPAHAMTAAEYTQGPCGSTLWAHNVGGYESSFVNGASAATAHGAVVTKVVEAPSVAVANQQQTVIAAPAYPACLKETITGEVRAQLPAGSGQAVTSVSITPFTLNLKTSSLAYVVAVTITGPGAATHQVTDNAVIIFSGRYAATLDVSSSSDAPLGSAIVQEQAANEATHLVALG